MPYRLQKVNKKYYVINSKSGEKYSKSPLSYEKARAQLRALYANEGGGLFQLHQLDTDGAGFFDSLKSVASNAYGRVKGFITGVRNDFQPKVRKLLNDIKDIPVVDMVVIREPIKKAIDILANVVSNGEINKYKKQYNIDDMFHLYAIATLKDGSLIRFEKNAEIDIERVKALPKLNSNFMYKCSIPSGDASLTNMLIKDRSVLGYEAFFTYSGLKYNCQHFIYNLLLNNGYASINNGMKEFIVQDLTDLANKTSSTSQRIMNGITTLGKRFQILTGGAGFFRNIGNAVGAYNTDTMNIRNKYNALKSDLAIATGSWAGNAKRPVVNEPSGGGLLGVGGAGQRRLKGGAFVFHPTQRPPVNQYFLKQQLIKKG